MDIGLQLLLAKSKLQKTKWRIKLTREELEEKRPDSIAFINGAKDVEQDLDEIQSIIEQLELELRMRGREINYALHINGLLKEKIEDQAHDIKFKNVQNEM